MALLQFFRRARALMSRSRHDDDLREEIAQHIEMRRQQLVGEGMDPREAAFEARRLFGHVTSIREETRDMWSFRWIETLAHDARFGARLLRRSPLFTLTAVSSLAIGIGSAAAVFSLADSLLFRALPVANPQELVLFRWASGPQIPFSSLNGFGNQNETETSSTSFSRSAYDAIRTKLSHDLEAFAFADLYRANLSIDGQADTAFAQVVSGNYFRALGVVPAAGRLLAPDDDRPDAPGAAVIGFDLWQRRFGGAADVVGKPIVVNGVQFTVAGVLPAGFTGTMQVAQPCDVMLPMSSYQAVTRGEDDPGNPNYWWVLMMGRLKPGVTAERIQPAADLLLKQTVTAVKPEFPAGALPRIQVEPGARGQTEIRNDMREPLGIMAAVVGIVLLVACANVANLLLARGRARTREIAVRAAIGAARFRIVRQLLTEGLLLGLVASAAGLVLAQWVSAALLPALAPGAEEPAMRFALDLRIVSFTCGLATACSILFALVPALKTTDGTLAHALQEASRGTESGRRRFSVGGALVVAQIALSMLLLTAAGLLAWSAQRLQRLDPGFEVENLLIFNVDTSLNGYTEGQSRAYVTRALEALRQLPGVTGASATSHRLISDSSSIGVARPEGVSAPPPGSAEAREFARGRRAWRLGVDEEFLETFGIPLLRGRSFPPVISADAPRVAIINVKLAQQLFNSSEVVGHRFVLGLMPTSPAIEIIGVAADAHYTSLQSDPPPTAYLPLQQSSVNRVTFAIRTAGDPLTFAGAARQTLRGIDDALPIFDVRTQHQQILKSLTRERLFANLAALLGIVALVLCGIGLYGLLAYAVTRRTPEIGVRIALGAERRQVRWMILRQSLLLVAGGLALGIPGALFSNALLESMLFGLSPRDPRTIAGAAIVLLAVALVAAYLPARRASRIDPLTALRTE
jgi:predicted permease